MTEYVPCPIRGPGKGNADNANSDGAAPKHQPHSPMLTRKQHQAVSPQSDTFCYHAQSAMSFASQILPPLLFEAAINIHWPELRREMLPVMVLSVFGVVISAAIVSAGMVWLLTWPVASALIFAILIAATDPVAVIAMFKDVGLTGRLRLLVESESLFNDGAAAVLFSLALTWAQGNASGVASAGWDLISSSGGGILVGLAAGAAGLVIVGRTTEHLVETAVTVAVAYGAFLVAG